MTKSEIPAVGFGPQLIRVEVELHGLIVAELYRKPETKRWFLDVVTDKAFSGMDLPEEGWPNQREAMKDIRLHLNGYLCYLLSCAVEEVQIGERAPEGPFPPNGETGHLVGDQEADASA